MPEKTTVVTQGGMVISFDGEVLEVFSYDESRRIHLRQITGIEVGKGFLGGTMLTVGVKPGNSYRVQLPLTEAETAQLQALVQSVNQAMAGA